VPASWFWEVFFEQPAIGLAAAARVHRVRMGSPEVAVNRSVWRSWHVAISGVTTA
jgi:hypothetical protein